MLRLELTSNLFKHLLFHPWKLILRAPDPEIVAPLPLFWAGPAPAQAAPDVSSTLESISEKLTEFGRTRNNLCKGLAKGRDVSEWEWKL